MTDWLRDPEGFNEAVVREFRALGGRVGGELAGMALLLLTTDDGRGGSRTTPLAYHRRDEAYLVIASNGGAPRHPGWFRNLQRSGDATVEVAAETFAAAARILAAPERDRVFAEIVARSPSAAVFQERAGRTIPVVELRRKPGATGCSGRTGAPARASAATPSSGASRRRARACAAGSRGA